MSGMRCRHSDKRLQVSTRSRRTSRKVGENATTSGVQSKWEPYAREQRARTGVESGPAESVHRVFPGVTWRRRSALTHPFPARSARRRVHPFQSDVRDRKRRLLVRLLLAAGRPRRVPTQAVNPSRRTARDATFPARWSPFVATNSSRAEWCSLVLGHRSGRRR